MGSAAGRHGTHWVWGVAAIAPRLAAGSVPAKVSKKSASKGRSSPRVICAHSRGSTSCQRP
eukprot:655556-Prymnesium_polylepis.1